MCYLWLLFLVRPFLKAWAHVIAFQPAPLSCTPSPFADEYIAPTYLKMTLKALFCHQPVWAKFPPDGFCLPTSPPMHFNHIPAGRMEALLTNCVYFPCWNVVSESRWWKGPERGEAAQECKPASPASPRSALCVSLGKSWAWGCEAQVRVWEATWSMACFCVTCQLRVDFALLNG